MKKFDRISHYFALFTLSAKCQFSTLEGHKASSHNYKNMFTVLYWLLPMFSEVVECLGYVYCQQPLQIQVKGVDLRLKLVANGVTRLYKE